jgi:dTMP kinase
MGRGRFIAFEGGEACGKSTQSRHLADALDAELTFEPGATQLGAALRTLLLHTDGAPVDPRAEALLMAADRAQHVAEQVEPWLAAGRHVVTDRYAGSSLAYQGFGRGLPVEEIRHLTEWGTGGLWPDLTILLVVSAEVVATRLSGTKLDRFEREDHDFHTRVADGFVALAQADPQRWVVLDADDSVEAVEASVRAAVRDRLGLFA